MATETTVRGDPEGVRSVFSVTAGRLVATALAVAVPLFVVPTTV